MTPQLFVDDLRTAGFGDVDDPWGLVNLKTRYPELVPVLVDWVERVERDPSAGDRQRFLEGLVRALGVSEARGNGAATALVRTFRLPDLDYFTRWAVGNSLSVIAVPSVFDDLVSLASDSTFGRTREMLPLAIARSDPDRAVDVLVDLLDDDDLVGHVIGALGKIGAREASPPIKELVHHPNPWVRKQAKKALRSFGEATD